jgi:hypothetical protein
MQTFIKLKDDVVNDVVFFYVNFVSNKVRHLLKSFLCVIQWNGNKTF